MLKRGYRIWPLYFSFVLLIAAAKVEARSNGGAAHLRVGPAARGAGAYHSLFFPAASRNSRLDVRAHSHPADGLAVGALIAWVQVFRPQLIRPGLCRSIAVTSRLAAGVALYVLNRDIFNFSTLGLIFGGMILAGLGIAPGIFRWHGFYLISRLSYGIYLNHFGLLPRIVHFLKPLQGHGYLGFLAGYLIAFLACMAFAAGTFLIVEYPFLRLRERWIKSSEPRKSAAEQVTVTQE